MSVTITINGESAEQARYEMERLLGTSKPAFVPAVSDMSSDTSQMTATEAAAVETVATKPAPRRGRPTKASTAIIEATATSVVVEPAQAISTGGERVDPDAQDAADEAPEAPAPETKTYTLDDVRNAAKPYIDKWTIAAAQTDLQEVLEAAAGVRAISKLNPADQGQLQRAVTAFEVASKAETRFVKKEG